MIKDRYTMKVHSINNERIILSVCEEGASILELSYINAAGRKINILRPYPDEPLAPRDFNPLLSGMFPMVPFVNRIKGNAFPLCGKIIQLPTHHLDKHFYLHGDGWINEWEITKSEHALCCYVESEIEGTCHYSAKQDIVLLDNEIIITLTVKNLGEQAFPYGIGLHPYFKYENDSLVSFEPNGVWLEQHDHLPGDFLQTIPEYLSFHNKKAPNNWLNNCYSFKDDVNVNIIHGNGIEVSLASDSKYMMIFRPSCEDDFICFEPQTQMLDAHNDVNHASLTLLEQNEELSLSLSIQLNEHHELDTKKV